MNERAEEVREQHEAYRRSQEVERELAALEARGPESGTPGPYPRAG